MQISEKSKRDSSQRPDQTVFYSKNWSKFSSKQFEQIRGSQNGSNLSYSNSTLASPDRALTSRSKNEHLAPRIVIKVTCVVLSLFFCRVPLFRIFRLKIKFFCKQITIKPLRMYSTRWWPVQNSIIWAQCSDVRQISMVTKSWMS